MYDPESYFSRKHIYSLKLQAVCDKNKRIRHLVCGHPGSVHDARIFSNCELATKPDEFFSGSQWLAGDSAYKLTKTELVHESDHCKTETYSIIILESIAFE